MPSSPKIKPCPFCGGECVVIDWELTCTVDCVAGECVYAAGHTSGESEAIAAHNKVAGAVEEVARLREALERANTDLESATQAYADSHGRKDRGERLFNRTTHAHYRIQRARAALGEGSP